MDFKFSTSSDEGILLNIHHTVRNENDATMLRVRFTAAGFTANNDRLIAADHRDNLFVFDLVHQKHWCLPALVEKVTVVEGVLGSHLVALGSRGGMLFIVDLDTAQCQVKLKVHAGRVLSLKKSPAGAASSGSKFPESFYLLVTTVNGAKVYAIDSFAEVSRLDYNLSSSDSVSLDQTHWFSSTHGPALISHTTSGILKVYRTNFKLIKELNAVKLIELHLKSRSAEVVDCALQQTTQLTGTKQDPSSGSNEIRMLIGRIIAKRHEGYLRGAQVTSDGRHYAMFCGNGTLAFLALDSWLIWRLVVLSNLFIQRFAFVPPVEPPNIAAPLVKFASGVTGAGLNGRRHWSTTAIALVAHTIDNDLVLVNFGQRTNRPVVVRSLLGFEMGRPTGTRCYKFALANNARMLASVLKSGEVRLHNLQRYAMQIVREPEDAAETTSGPTTRSPAHYCAVRSSSSGRPDYRGSTQPRSWRRIKNDRQMDAVQSQIAHNLPKDRLLPILKEYGEYPAKHRPTIWRGVLELPGDAESFGAFLQRGQHPCVVDYDKRFAEVADQRTVRSLKKIVSCLAHWCPVFGLVDYVPTFVLPFARSLPNDALTLFETVATILLNQCQLWFEFAPLEPFNYLAMVTNVLAECDPRLMHFYRRHHIESRTYALPLMESGFAACCPDSHHWQCLWDHVLSNEPYFPVFLIVAYSSVHRGVLMALQTAAEIENFFRHLPDAAIDVRRLIRRAYDLMDRQGTGFIHPQHYIKSFVPLNSIGSSSSSAGAAFRPGDGGPSSGGSAVDCESSSPSTASDTSVCVGDGPSRTYACFSNFPKKLTEARCVQVGALQAEQHRLEAKIIELEKLEHSLQDRMVNNLIRQEHEQRLQEVERKFEDAISREEQRLEMQRKLLLLHRKQLRERESELSLDLHNAKLVSDASIRERDLETLLKKLDREKQREETDLLFAEEDIKLKELELVGRYRSGLAVEASRLPTEDSSGWPEPSRGHMEHRYHAALEQLAVQKQKLYDEIDLTYSSLGLQPGAGANEYTYRTVSELRKVATIASNERFPLKTEASESKEQSSSSVKKSDQVPATSQLKLYEDKIRKVEEQVKILQRLKQDRTHKTSTKLDP
ncbi:TBC1 domain family member 31 [Anopheles bellator]|uniref:TBC1 domain family member 31 n=1 Tax=Anopheles bellator TaxID=139047 RepID=UPI002647E728|nr:TBC1 domain family member 31 [Anopheles bellator]